MTDHIADASKMVQGGPHYGMDLYQIRRSTEGTTWTCLEDAVNQAKKLADKDHAYRVWKLELEVRADE